MNPAMKYLVDVAFRVRSFNRTTMDAHTAGKPTPPRPKVITEFFRRIAGLPLEGPTGDKLSEEQMRLIVRVAQTLDWFALHGCPIVSLDEATANAFASALPPVEARVEEWPLGSAYGISIGEGSMLVRHAMRPVHMPEENRQYFDFVDGIIPTEAWTTGIDFLGESDSLTNLTESIGAAIVSQPTGLTITERHPSRQAARKHGLDPDRIPVVEWIIGSEIKLGARSEASAAIGEPSDRRLKVRTAVSPHWTHQPHGPRSSLRRLQWIATHWKGPEDAPVSVHALRLTGQRK